MDNPHIRDLLGDVARREEILRGVGAYHFPNNTAAEQRKWAKALFNSLDMDGTYMGWRERYRVPVFTTSLPYFSPVLFADFIPVQFDDGFLDMPPLPRPNPPESV